MIASQPEQWSTTPAHVEMQTPRGATDLLAALIVCDGIKHVKPLATVEIGEYVHPGSIRSSITVCCILCIELTWRWLLEL
jgi:hypothetical protein